MRQAISMDDNGFESQAEELVDGVYDLMFTQAIDSHSEAAFRRNDQAIVDSDVARSLMNHLLPVIQSHIESHSSPQAQIAATNAILQFIGRDQDTVSEQRRLTGVVNSEYHGVSKISKLPIVPLSELALLTNLPNEPKLGTEIKAEFASADSVDIVMSFVMIRGINYLENELLDFANRGGRIRLITTTYMGNSDARAVIDLAERFNAEVRISLDSSKDRLHAKSWIFHRATGFSSAYVGSSNLSYSALNDGNEWNIKISKRSSRELFAKIEASFDALWNGDALLAFDPHLHSDLLIAALAGAKFPNSGTAPTPLMYNFIDVTPKAHQVAMLADLAKERQVFNRHWNMVVAATGTGKTMLSALDYRSFVTAGTPRPSLLFVAHKQEILEQALQTFRVALRDQSFGELLVGGHKPKEWKHVFASIQSLNQKNLDDFAPDFFDYVVVDEFHHAQARTYKELLAYLQPRELLALTATPERTDLVNIQDVYFEGRIASELRLWDAIDEALLVPFNYFGIGDGTDLSQVKWSQGSYSVADLESVFIANESRNTIIHNSLVKYLPQPEQARILTFCVSKLHAQHMSDFFSARGFRSKCVTSDTPMSERVLAREQLARGELNIICAVDIFNEGVDIPAVDTVLFLRPTESPVVFLQQLGRGLRTMEGKSVLTVLDFVGVHRAEYKFVKKLQALTGQSAFGIRQSLEADFPYLPNGCQIVFDKKSKELILSNLKSQVSSLFRDMVDDLKNRGDISLSDFLSENDLSIGDVYGKGRSWSELRRSAGLISEDLSKEIKVLAHRFANFSFASDPLRNSFYRRLVKGEVVAFDHLSQQEKTLTAMMFWSLFPDAKFAGEPAFATYQAGLDFVRSHEYLVTELEQVLDYARSTCSFVPERLSDQLPDSPLQSHASYSRPELLAAVGYAHLCNQDIGISDTTKTRSASAHMTGVHFAKNLNADIFFVTLDKSGGNFSLKTAYKDYAISKWLFHWDSQNKDSPTTPTGKRYLSHQDDSHLLLLAVRAKPVDELGTAPFQLLGAGDVESHSGAFPMQLTLRMHREMPLGIVSASPVYTAG